MRQPADRTGAPGGIAIERGRRVEFDANPDFERFVVREGRKRKRAGLMHDRARKRAHAGVAMREEHRFRAAFGKRGFETAFVREQALVECFPDDARLGDAPVGERLALVGGCRGEDGIGARLLAGTRNGLGGVAETDDEHAARAGSGNA